MPAGKRVATIAAGQYHALALCTDATLLTWGYNNRGQLGDGGTAPRNAPVVIGNSDALKGKTVVEIGAGGSHSLALCSDGTLASWGYNNFGQLGVAGIAQSASPLAVNLAGITAGNTPSRIACGGSHSLLLGSQGSLLAWGENADGQLGDGGTTTRTEPGAVDMGSLAVGARVISLAGGSAARHNLVLVALPAASINQTATRDVALPAASADADHNGIPDLIEYAFGLNAGPLPQPQRLGEGYGIRFTQPAGVRGIHYGAEWSRTMESGTWHDVPDTGTGDEHVFSVPMGSFPKWFMRLKVSVP
jgi:hypothetical protein